MEEKYYLRLYISPESESPQIALENLEAICKEYLGGKHQIEVIDVSRNPGMTEEDKVMVISTLIKKFPLPLKKIIGDLQNKEKVLIAMDLIPRKEDENEKSKS